MTRYTASLVPDAARIAIGDRLTGEVRHLTGAPCAAPAGQRALAKLEARLFPDGNTKLAVLPSALTETTHTPGGALLISHKLVEDYETPEVLAGYLLAEDLRRRTSDPLEGVLTTAGFGAALRLLTTGKIDDDALRKHAEYIVAKMPPPVADGALIDVLKRSGIPGAPYAYAIDFSGEKTAHLIDASAEEVSPLPLLDDGDWLALQHICED